MKEIEIVIDNDLAAFLAEDGELELYVNSADETAQSQALECGLETVAAVVSIVAGTIAIGEAAVKFTKKTQEWLASRKQDSTSIVCRGEADDSAFSIDKETDPAVIEDIFNRSAFDSNE